MTRKIKHQELEKTGRIPKPEVSRFNEDLHFSFKYLDLRGNQKFTLVNKTEEYFSSLFQRLKDVSSIKCSEFMANRSSALRSHPIKWEDTTEPNGFRNLNQQLKEEPAFQFELTANAHGRVHGIIIDNIFYIIWFDPEHALYD